MSPSLSLTGIFAPKRALSIALLMLVWTLDFLTPSALAHGIWYLPVVILALRVEQPHFPEAILCLSLAGIAMGVVLASEQPSLVPYNYLIANRVFSAAVLIIIFYLVKHIQQLQVAKFALTKQQKESDRFFRQFAESLPIQIWTAAPDGQIDFVCLKLAQFAHKTPLEMPADWTHYIHPDDREKTLSLWDQAVAMGEPYMTDVRLRRHDGVYIWFKNQAAPARDCSGTITRWYGSSIDVSDLRLLQEQAEQLSEKLRHILESITDAFFTLDAEFRFNYLNSRLTGILGSTEQALLGGIIWDVTGIRSDDVFATHFKEALRTQEPVIFEALLEPSNRWLEARVYPSLEGLTVFLADVTAQREDKEQLRLLTTAVSRLNDIILITKAEPLDEPGPQTVFVNEAFERRTGYAMSEVIGKTPRILQGPKTQHTELARIRQALQAWQPVRAELINYTKAGEEFWLELDIVPIANEAGWYTHWVSVERDITERKRLEAQLAAARKMESIGQLTGGISHDFNNLLTVILGNAELLEEQLADKPELASLANLICQASEKGAALTRNLLAFARQQPLSPQAIDVGALLRTLLPILNISAGDRNQLNLATPDDLWPVMIDPGLLENCIINLTLNARDAMPESGTISINTTNFRVTRGDLVTESGLAPGDHVRIVVSDTGEGMATDRLEKIFEPFFTTKPEGQGNGLGLSMVYGFVKQSGGQITVDSEPGRGTTFILYLPRTEEAIEDPAEPRQVLETGADNDLTVMVVEDNPEILTLAATILSQDGYRVIAASSGDDALRQLRPGKIPDLLFTDVVMPGDLSGPELAVNAQDLLPDLKVIFTSGFAELGALFRCKRDAPLMLPKPYRRDQLLALVRQAFDAPAPAKMACQEKTEASR